MKRLRIIGIIISIPLFLVVLILLFLTFRPMGLDVLSAHPNPAADFAEASSGIEHLQARDTDEVHPLCHSQALTHGERTERVIVFIHGYTNCPEQFRILGEMFYEQGYNVLIPRLPHNGLRNRLNDEQGLLTAEQLVDYADEAIDIAAGLGEQVIVAGISGGGVLTAWAAQEREEVTLALVIAPTFSYQSVPSSFSLQLTNLALVIPNQFVWWDDELQADAPGPQYGYPRFATRTVGEILRLGQRVQQQAQIFAPQADSIIVTTNPNDLIVDNLLIDSLVNDWNEHSAQVEVYEFSADLDVGHDVIDPFQPDQRTAEIYPIFIDLITSH